MIIKSEHKNTALFFTPFEGLSNEIQTVLDSTAVFPTQNIAFQINGKDYKLIPTGKVLSENGGERLSEKQINAMNKDEWEYTIIEDYELTLAFPNGKRLFLASAKRHSNGVPTIIWAGDLNQDGLPDIILNMGDFYESPYFYFFLSDKEDSERPLKKVAELRVVNDC